MINPGAYNKKIDILKPNGVTSNTLGQGVPKYELFKTVWASISPLSGKEYHEAQMIRAETTYRIKMWYVDGVLPDMKISYNGREFEIISILNMGERNTELHIICIEKYPVGADGHGG